MVVGCHHRRRLQIAITRARNPQIREYQGSPKPDIAARLTVLRHFGTRSADAASAWLVM